MVISILIGVIGNLKYSYTLIITVITKSHDPFSVGNRVWGRAPFKGSFRGFRVWGFRVQGLGF